MRRCTAPTPERPCCGRVRRCLGQPGRSAAGTGCGTAAGDGWLPAPTPAVVPRPPPPPTRPVPRSTGRAISASNDSGAACGWRGPPHQAGRPSGPIAAVPLLLLPAQAPRPATPPRGAPPGSRPHPLLTSSTARHHRARVPPTSRTTNIPCHQHPHRRAAAWVRGGWRLGRRGFRRARWRRPSAADRAGPRARQVGCAGHL